MNTPYQMLVPKYSTYPSVVGYLGERGHKAIAVHPYMTSMYKREQVYSSLGIQDFIHDTTMASAEKIQDNPFISDESAFSEVEHQIESSAQPLLVNLVTMQNHYPMADLYDEPWPVSGISGDTKDELAGYARGLNYSDRALQSFIESLEASDEKTAVIFYGDHQPAFWSNDIIEQNDDRAMHETPFFIWTNFKQLPANDMGVTSPIHFMPTLFDALGAELPPYYVLLQRLHAEIPAMEQGVYYNAEGEPLNEDDLSAEAQAILHDYELVQYDMSIGERYAQDMYYPEN
jgi:phosphoglycerol transferase MdoB-like AlkP superfamily enzyme